MGRFSKSSSEGSHDFLPWKAWLEWCTVQGKHLWVLRPFPNHTVVCTWPQGNKLAESICSQTLLNESWGKHFFTSFRKGWSFAVFALYPVKHGLSIVYIFTVSQRTGVGETTHSKVMKCSQAINICLAFIISPEDYIWSPVSRVCPCLPHPVMANQSRWPNPTAPQPAAPLHDGEPMSKLHAQTTMHENCWFLLTYRTVLASRM